NFHQRGIKHMQPQAQGETERGSEAILNVNREIREHRPNAETQSSQSHAEEIQKSNIPFPSAKLSVLRASEFVSRGVLSEECTRPGRKCEATKLREFHAACIFIVAAAETATLHHISHIDAGPVRLNIDSQGKVQMQKRKLGKGNLEVSA